MEAATRLAAHRGKDGEGYFMGSCFGLAHCRLAVFGLSEKGRQPMEYQGLTITFNGAVFNYLELREQLRREGFSFQTETDTEVALAAYSYWGESCLKHFNGMWAFVLYDAARQQLFAARDRFGIKPLYYAQLGRQFCLASELKQFTAMEGWAGRPNLARCYEFLAHGRQNHSRETLFEGVFQLPAGHWLRYNLRTHHWDSGPYYRLEEEISPGVLPFPEAMEQFTWLLEDSIRLRLRSDVPLGLMLSGGLDSASIALLAGRLIKATSGDGPPLSTVSVCFDEPEIDERPYIEAVTKTSGAVSHQVFPDFQGLQDLWKIISWHQDEPLASGSVFAQYLAFAEARNQGLSVMLGGQGADEILMGYDTSIPLHLKTLLRHNPLGAALEALAFLGLHRHSLARRLARREGKKQADELLSLLHPSLMPEAGQLLAQPRPRNLHELSLQFIQQSPLPSLLHFEDRNAMAHAVESRIPFLDHRLVEFCLSQPDSYLIRNGKRKYLLRQALRGLLPGLVLRRYDKLAFATPQYRWMEKHPAFFTIPPQSELLLFDKPHKANEHILRILQEKRHAGFPLIWRMKGFAEWFKLFFGN